MLKFPDIVLHNRILVHGSIHSRRKKLLTSAGHNCCRKHIIGKTIGNLSNYIALAGAIITMSAFFAMETCST